MAGFQEKVVQAGGTIKLLSSSSEIDSEIRKMYPDALKIVDCTNTTSLGTVPV